MGYRLGSVEFQKQRQAKEQEIKNRQAGAGIKPPSALVPVLPSQEPELVTEVEPAQKEPQYLAPEPPMGDRLAGDEKPIQLSGIEKKVYGALTGKDPSAAERPTVKDIQVGTEAAASPAAVDTIPKQEDRDWYVERMNSLVEARNQAYNTYAKGLEQAESEKERRDMAIAFGKILETLGHGLIKIGAANYGLKKGVDMSGLKFDKNDWDASFQLSQRSYEARLGSLQEMLAEKEKSLRGLEEEAGQLKRQEEEQKALNQRAEAKRLLDEQQAIQKEKWDRERLASQQKHEIYMQTLKNAARGDTEAKRLADRQFKQNLRGLETDIDDLELQLKTMTKAREALDKKDVDTALLKLQEAGLDLTSFEQAKEDKPWYQVFTSEKDLLKEYLNNQSSQANAALQEQKALRRKLLFAEDKYLPEDTNSAVAQVPERPSTQAAPLPSAQPSGKVILKSASELPDIGD
jgi:hypothetical protein